uniref:Uncharacterized protein n=1 Tax=Romanomermis culicivorax TaxID=13658 RepID=A0A915J6M0_ROMCU
MLELKEHAEKDLKYECNKKKLSDFFGGHTIKRSNAELHSLEIPETEASETPLVTTDNDEEPAKKKLKNKLWRLNATILHLFSDDRCSNPHESVLIEPEREIEENWDEHWMPRIYGIQH